jgi:CelD/BcsL family acetyltransferase involved in cellulose biosynthesis
MRRHASRNQRRMGERDAGRPRLVLQTRLGSHQAAWDALVERLPLPSPFLRSWWLEHTAGPNPRFLLVLDGGTLLGGLALEEERWLGLPRLRVMGAGALCPDHHDIVALPGRDEEVLSTLAAWLRRPGSRLLDLEGVATGARLAAALPGRVRREVVDVAPWTPLSADPGDWLRARSRNFRSNLRKAVNRFGNQGATYRVARGDQVEAALADLRHLHAARWDARSRFLAVYDRFAAAAREGAARGEVAVHELVADGTVVAAMGCFEVARRVSFYQSGWLPEHRWRNASTLLLARMVEDACRRGFTEIDLLRGNEPYKYAFASGRRELLRLRASHGAAGRAALAALTLASRSRRLVGRALAARRGAATATPTAGRHGRLDGSDAGARTPASARPSYHR